MNLEVAGECKTGRMVLVGGSLVALWLLVRLIQDLLLVGGSLVTVAGGLLDLVEKLSMGFWTLLKVYNFA